MAAPAEPVGAASSVPSSAPTSGRRAIGWAVVALVVGVLVQPFLGASIAVAAALGDRVQPWPRRAALLALALLLVLYGTFFSVVPLGLGGEGDWSEDGGPVR